MKYAVAGQAISGSLKYDGMIPLPVKDDGVTLPDGAEWKVRSRHFHFGDADGGQTILVAYQVKEKSVKFEPE